MLKHRLITFLILLANTPYAWAADGAPMNTAKDFSEQMLKIVQGPISKVLAAAVLLVGIAGLLRGRHKLAVSCGLAFLLLLFLPMLVDHVSGS